MNLDSTALYKLTKIGIKNGESRFFQPGDTHVGQAQIFGNSLLIGGIRTSDFVKTTEMQNGNYLVETKNSVYTLEKLVDEV